MSEELKNNPGEKTGTSGKGDKTSEGLSITKLNGMYEEYFIDYASYVILERAVPHMLDGLKPVQRRILHSMKRLDDGRYNKVANIIGHTMQFHPHGDASIGDALVQLGQKELLIDTQGNWGNVFTGDSSAAPRYIEARLSSFANDVVFNPKTTEWQLSYDGRNKEPVTLPLKFPLLLAQGAEGIAVGLSSKILPHNFNELIDASILHLQGKSFEIYPDFPTGGNADFSRYNDGMRGGQIRVRAKIEKLDKKTLVIRDLPFGKTTGTLIESVIKANDKGKIKIKKIDDNTAEFVEIMVHLAPNISSDKTIDALYAFTDCEVSISPNCCIIENDKPRFIGVSEVLRTNTEHTKELLKQELEIRLSELEENWHMSSLEKIFIEERIYRDIEECETWEAVIEAIDKGLDPFKKFLRRDVSRDDIVKLTEIKIKRISKYDVKKANEIIQGIEDEIAEVKNNLNHLVDYCIEYFRRIKKKHGKNKERKTEIKSFENIVASKVVVANEKLYVNRVDGFIGTGLKKDEYICDCSDIDDVIVFLKDGTYLITKVADKIFIGKNIIYAGVFKKNDKRTIYNVIYYDGNTGNTMMKRSSIKAVTRDKPYNIGKEHKNTRILYMTVNPNGEAETVKVTLKPRPRLKKPVFDMDFSELAIKGRNAAGNILSKYAVHKITMKEKGVSTLGGRKIWFDHDVHRLNADSRGTFLGEFSGEDKILVITKTGNFRITNFDLTNHFEDDLLIIEKYVADKIWSAVYFDADQDYHYIKRFGIDPLEKPTGFIGENPESNLVLITKTQHPRFEIKFGGKNKDREPEIIDANDFIGIKSYKAKGKRLSNYEIKNIEEIEPLIPDEEEENGNLGNDSDAGSNEGGSSEGASNEGASNEGESNVSVKDDQTTSEQNEPDKNTVDDIKVSSKEAKETNDKTADSKKADKKTGDPVKKAGDSSKTKVRADKQLKDKKSGQKSGKTEPTEEAQSPEDVPLEITPTKKEEEVSNDQLKAESDQDESKKPEENKQKKKRKDDDSSSGQMRLEL